MIRAARRLRSPRRLLAGGLVAVPLITTGCGPSVPVQIGIKNVPLDIAVGRDTADTPPRPHAAPPPAEALPAFAQPVQFGSGFAAPAPVFASTLPQRPGAVAVCSQLDPTKASPAAATPEVDGPVTAGNWPFRTTGGVTDNGAAIPLPATQVRTLKTLSSSTGVFDFEQSGGALGFLGATADFEASNSSTAPANPATSPTSYVGLRSLSVPTATGLPVVFRPATPLHLLDTPAQAASTYQPDPNNPALPNSTGSWSDSQSDPADGTSATIQASNLGQVRVNACGTPVDAWQVHATITLTGSFVSAGTVKLPAQTSLTLDATYAVATGMGGMIVAETVKTVQGTAPASNQLAGHTYAIDDGVTLSSPTPQHS